MFLEVLFISMSGPFTKLRFSIRIVVAAARLTNIIFVVQFCCVMYYVEIIVDEPREKDITTALNFLLKASNMTDSTSCCVVTEEMVMLAGIIFVSYSSSLDGVKP